MSLFKPWKGIYSSDRGIGSTFRHLIQASCDSTVSLAILHQTEAPQLHSIDILYTIYPSHHHCQACLSLRIMSTNQEPSNFALFSQRRLLGTLWTGVAVSFCFLLFRFYVRLKTFRRLDIDDPFVFVAWLMILANAIVWQVTSKEIYIIIAVDTGQILMAKPEYISRVSILHRSLIATYFLYYTALWSIKISFLLFFRNLSKTIRRQMLLWYLVSAITIASYISCLCMINYKCLVGPPRIAECQNFHTAHYLIRYLRVATVFDTVTDGLIILISINLLWNASIEIRKKLALTGIFSLTVFVICVSIVRVVLTTGGPRIDHTWLLLWSGLEMTVATIVACLASFRILYTSSERFRRSAFIVDHSNGAAEGLGNGQSILLNARVLSSTSIIPSRDIHIERQSSADTFEEAILPMDNVYVQHKYNHAPGSRMRHEEIQSPLESPAIRPHDHWLPLYTEIQDTG